MPQLPDATIEIILSNEPLPARQIAAALALSRRTVEGVRRRYLRHPRGRYPHARVRAIGVLRQGPLAPAQGVAQEAGCSAGTVRRARRVLFRSW